MAKKRLFKDKPIIDKRGQYHFFDDDASTYSDSNGIPLRYDKFVNRDLYSYVQEDETNSRIVDYQVPYNGLSSVKVNKLDIRNAGVNYKMKSVHFIMWMFDSIAFDNLTSYDNIIYWSDAADAGLNTNARIYDRWVGNAGEGWSPGELIKDQIVLENLDKPPGTEPANTSAETNMIEVPAFSYGGGNLPYITNKAFKATDIGNSPATTIFRPSDQSLYFVIYCGGDAKRWFGRDKRRKRLHVFKVPTDQLFTPDSLFGKETTFDFTYSDASVFEGHGGGGGVEVPAFYVKELSITIDTKGGEPVSTFYQGDLSTYPTVSEQDDPYENLHQSILDMTGSILPSREFSLNNIDQSFIQQHPNRAVSNLWKLAGNTSPTINTNYHYSMLQYKENFEPVPNLTILDETKYNLQAYQTSSIEQQICSSPTMVNLNFDISNWYEEIDYDLTTSDFGMNDLPLSSSYYQMLGSVYYMFYVVSWDDEDDKFTNPSDFIEDKPINTFELLKKREENLYKFSISSGGGYQQNPSTPGLTHSYLSPGVKTIKSVLVSFSNTSTSGDLNIVPQIIRWKFITSRLFLDISSNAYPDFNQLGGADFVTMPWSYTTPLIGGTSENSKYNISLKDTLSGGKLGDKDIIDERFLVDADANDELGESINKFDLEQVRYFINGSYDMNKLLGIEDRITTDGTDFTPYTSNKEDQRWDCRDWDMERNYCFSDETSVGEIFISDNSDLNLRKNCKFEFNCGMISKKTILDSSGNGHKGILIGDYKVKKRNKNQPAQRDSFIKIPKTDTTEGAI